MKPTHARAALPTAPPVSLIDAVGSSTPPTCPPEPECILLAAPPPLLSPPLLHCALAQPLPQRQRSPARLRVLLSLGIAPQAVYVAVREV